MPEDALLRDARARAAQLGCVPVGPGSGAALRFLAALLDARSVMEIGTGAGVSGLWLLRGMRPDGVLTSVDVEAEHQRHAREVFTAEGVARDRTRLITGRALEVLPRFTDGAYDLVLVDGDKDEYGDYLEQALRLLRPGGVLAVDNALWHDRVGRPGAARPETPPPSAAGPGASPRTSGCCRCCCRSATGCSRRSCGLTRPSRRSVTTRAGRGRPPPQPGRGRRAVVRGLSRPPRQLRAEILRLVRRQLDDKPAAALERDAHDDAATLLGDLERAIARPRLHGGHTAPLSHWLRAAGRDRAQSGWHPLSLI